MRVVDEDGVWFTNTGHFCFVDPTTNTRFDAGETVKVKPNPWLKSQPVFVAKEETKEEAKPEIKLKVKA
jgi:hypothetical protein